VRGHPGKKIAHDAHRSDTDKKTEGVIDRVRFSPLKYANASTEQDQQQSDRPEFYTLEQGKESLFRHFVPLLPTLKKLSDDGAKGAKKKREKHTKKTFFVPYRRFTSLKKAWKHKKVEDSLHGYARQGPRCVRSTIIRTIFARRLRVMFDRRNRPATCPGDDSQRAS
jgi:hypothetical protein